MNNIKYQNKKHRRPTNKKKSAAGNTKAMTTNAQGHSNTNTIQPKNRSSSMTWIIIYLWPILKAAIIFLGICIGVLYILGVKLIPSDTNTYYVMDFLAKNNHKVNKIRSAL